MDLLKQKMLLQTLLRPEQLGVMEIIDSDETFFAYFYLSQFLSCVLKADCSFSIRRAAYEYTLSHTDTD